MTSQSNLLPIYPGLEGETPLLRQPNAHRSSEVFTQLCTQLMERRCAPRTQCQLQHPCHFHICGTSQHFDTKVRSSFLHELPPDASLKAFLVLLLECRLKTSQQLCKKEMK